MSAQSRRTAVCVSVMVLLGAAAAPGYQQQDPAALMASGDVVDEATNVDEAPKLAESLASLAAKGSRYQMVDVVVSYNTPPKSRELTLAAQAGAVSSRQYQRLPFQVLRLPASGLKTLAEDWNVRFVSPDSPVFGASRPGRQAARVPGSTYALNTPNKNFRGAGVTVAVVDTGVAPHDDFHSLVAQYDFVNGASGTPTAFSDPFGHGTHVAGMIGADGHNSSFDAQYRGAATQASIVSLRVLDGEGRGNLSDVLRALDWILTTGISQHGIRVANLSLGKSVEEAQAFDPLVQAVDAVWDAGVVVVVSAGNHGLSGHYTITSPGISRKVITVGSLTDHGSGTNYTDDRVSSFSSRGPTLFDHVLKPDLLAPGNKIVSPFSENSYLGTLLPTTRVFCGLVNSCQSRYLQLSGTSMAAGVVSGAVARILEKDPSLGPPTVKARLMRSARKIPGDPTVTGAGVLDVEGAMNATGTVSGQALSPLMDLDAENEIVHVQDPALLWGSAIWAAGSLWPDGSLWSPAPDGFLWSEGSLWPDGSLWADAYLWSEGFLWSEAVAPAAADIEDIDQGVPDEEPELP